MHRAAIYYPRDQQKQKAIERFPSTDNVHVNKVSFSSKKNENVNLLMSYTSLFSLSLSFLPSNIRFMLRLSTQQLL